MQQYKQITLTVVETYIDTDLSQVGHIRLAYR